MVDPLAAQTADDDQPCHSPGERLANGKLGVRFVLVRIDPMHRHAGSLERRHAVRVERVAVTDPGVDGDAEPGGVPGPAIGGDDKADVGIPARPRAVERGTDGCFAEQDRASRSGREKWAYCWDSPNP